MACHLRLADIAGVDILPCSQVSATHRWNLRIPYPDSKVHGANMGPAWVLSAPTGPHVGPMNLAIRVSSKELYYLDLDIGYWESTPGIDGQATCPITIALLSELLPTGVLLKTKKCLSMGNWMQNTMCWKNALNNAMLLEHLTSHISSSGKCFHLMTSSCTLSELLPYPDGDGMDWRLFAEKRDDTDGYIDGSVVPHW